MLLSPDACRRRVDDAALQLSAGRRLFERLGKGLLRLTRETEPEPAFARRPRTKAVGELGAHIAVKRGTRLTLPAPVPEIPAASIDRAAAYYVDTLGFSFDWGDERGGIAGISRGNCRLFLTNRPFRESYGNVGPILFWLNLESKAEVDELFAQWKAAQATIFSEPEDKPWMLREFVAADLDGNLIRVFYDFHSDV